MLQSPDKVIEKIKQIRKIRQHSIHDCASLLEISKERYLEFEQGSAFLTLPEIEILAIYFGVPTAAFFNKATIEENLYTVLHSRFQQRFKDLRHKMICAKFASEIESKGLTLQNIHEMTQIPVNDLKDYTTGVSTIPLHHLILISDALSLPVEFFYSDTWLLNDDTADNKSQEKWQPEFPEENAQANSEDDSYQLLLKALKKLPKAEQARIAKTLLEKLKTL